MLPLHVDSQTLRVSRSLPHRLSLCCPAPYHAGSGTARAVAGKAPRVVLYCLAPCCVADLFTMFEDGRGKRCADGPVEGSSAL